MMRLRGTLFLLLLLGQVPVAQAQSICPTITKVFDPNSVIVGVETQLIITLTNNNSVALTNAAFTDTYPTQIKNAFTPSEITTCGGTLTAAAFGGSVSLSGGTIPANSFCTVTVKVISNAAGTYTNTIPTGGLTTGNSCPNLAAGSADLTVGEGDSEFIPPTVIKNFSPDPIAIGGTSVLTITLGNPNAIGADINIFTDTYPTQIKNANIPNASSTCGVTPTAAANGTGVSLNGGTIPANGTCTVTVTVTSSTVGTHTNTIFAGGLNTLLGENAFDVSDALTVTASAAPPTIAKSFTPSTIQNSGTSTLTLTIGNPAGNPAGTLTGVAVTDTYPAAITNRTPANPAVSCTSGSSGSFTGGANGGSTIGFTGGNILPGGSCTVTVDVTSTTNITTPGHQNTTGNVTSVNGGTGGVATAGLIVRASVVPPVITKVFSPDVLPVNGVSTLIFTIKNPNGTSTLFDVNFTDTYPAGLVNAATPNVNSNCDQVAGGAAATFGGAAGGNTIGLPTGSTPNDMPANSTCTVTVDVTSTTAGTYNNNTTPVMAVEAFFLTGNTASDTITFFASGAALLTVVKSSLVFSDPFNGTTNPRRIPGSFVTYNIVTTNSGAGAVNNNSVVMTDPIPANTDLFVGDLAGAGSGPVTFVDGTPGSGLTYTFTSLASTTDDVSFSSDGGTSFTYTPAPDVNGVDPAVTHIRVNPKGVYAGDAVAGAPSPNFTLNFRVRVE